MRHEVLKLFVLSASNGALGSPHFERRTSGLSNVDEALPKTVVRWRYRPIADYRAVRKRSYRYIATWPGTLGQHKYFPRVRYRIRTLFGSIRDGSDTGSQ